MTTEQAQKVLDELQGVRPEVLTGEAKRLFEAIMKIVNERDLYKSMLEEKDKVIDLLVRELYKKAHICTRCYLQESVEECTKFKNCWECLRIHFENKAKEV